MNKALIVSNISHAYNGVNVLNELSFDIDYGGFFVIIGPNGSGKTTLVRLITGIEKISSGCIEVMGSSLNNYTSKELAKTIAYVPQNIPIDFSFTVSEVVCMGRSPYLGLFGFTSFYDKKIILESMKITGVDKLANRMIHQLSGGERQRVFIARAICQQPKIMVLDEPTASLDIAHQVKIMDLMERLIKEKNITVIMISHDINLAALYCSDLLLIKDGGIVLKGSPERVLDFSILETTYGCSMLVDDSPFDNILRVTPIPSRYFNSDM